MFEKNVFDHKVSFKIVTNDIISIFFIIFFYHKKIRLDIACEMQTVHIKFQTLFSI